MFFKKHLISSLHSIIYVFVINSHNTGKAKSDNGNKSSIFIFCSICRLLAFAHSCLKVLIIKSAFSIIVFLIQEYGNDKFLDFCRKLRDGEAWSEALLKTYHFFDFNDMERAWKIFILKGDGNGQRV